MFSWMFLILGTVDFNICSRENCIIFIVIYICPQVMSVCIFMSGFKYGETQQKKLFD